MQWKLHVRKERYKLGGCCCHHEFCEFFLMWIIVFSCRRRVGASLDHNDILVCMVRVERTLGHMGRSELLAFVITLPTL